MSSAHLITGRRGPLEIRIVKEAAGFTVRVVYHVPGTPVRSEVFVNVAASIEEAKEMAVRGLATVLDEPAEQVRRDIIWTDAEVTAD